MLRRTTSRLAEAERLQSETMALLVNCFLKQLLNKDEQIGRAASLVEIQVSKSRPTIESLIAGSKLQQARL